MQTPMTGQAVTKEQAVAIAELIKEQLESVYAELLTMRKPDARVMEGLREPTQGRQRRSRAASVIRARRRSLPASALHRPCGRVARAAHRPLRTDDGVRLLARGEGARENAFAGGKTCSPVVRSRFTRRRRG